MRRTRRRPPSTRRLCDRADEHAGLQRSAGTNDVASLLLKGLGYQQHLDTLSVAITYRALANGQLDVFLGDWTPAHDSFTAPLLAAHKIQRLGGI